MLHKARPFINHYPPTAPIPRLLTQFVIVYVLLFVAGWLLCTTGLAGQLCADFKTLVARLYTAAAALLLNSAGYQAMAYKRMLTLDGRAGVYLADNTLLIMPTLVIATLILINATRVKLFTMAALITWVLLVFCMGTMRCTVEALYRLQNHNLPAAYDLGHVPFAYGLGLLITWIHLRKQV